MITYLLMPLFFIALILYVSWPVLNEDEQAAQEPKPAVKKKKR